MKKYRLRLVECFKNNFSSFIQASFLGKSLLHYWEMVILVNIWVYCLVIAGTLMYEGECIKLICKYTSCTQYLLPICCMQIVF